VLLSVAADETRVQDERDDAADQDRERAEPPEPASPSGCASTLAEAVVRVQPAREDWRFRVHGELGTIRGHRHFGKRLWITAACGFRHKRAGETCGQTRTRPNLT
jgi:hypothetical protein